MCIELACLSESSKPPIFGVPDFHDFNDVIERNSPRLSGIQNGIGYVSRIFVKPSFCSNAFV